MAGDGKPIQGEAEEAAVIGAEATTQSYEQALSQAAPPSVELVLYVAGAAPRSLRAIATIRRLCAQHLPGCHELQVVDIYQEPAIAERDGVLAVPALIKKRPLPRQTMVGDMSDLQRVLDGLGIRTTDAGEAGR